MSRRCFIRLLSTGAALYAVQAGAAHASDLSVTTATTTPVTTAQASGNSAGNITVASGGSIIVTGPTAVTVNSSNNLTNSGTISSSATSNAIVVLVDGTNPITTTIDNEAAISVTGTGGTGNIGLEVANGPVVGSIISGRSSTIAVTGDNAIAAAILSPFTGNVTLTGMSVTGANSDDLKITGAITGNVTVNGAISTSGAGGAGVLVLAPISGTLDNGGSIVGGAPITSSTASNGSVTTNAALAPQGGVVIGANVGAGFINDNYVYDPTTGQVVAPANATTSDINVVSAIGTYGGGPAVLVQPQAAAPQSITIGAAAATGSADAYAIVNKGSMTAAGSNVGTSATAIEVSGATIGGTAYTTTLVGGIANEAPGSINVTSVDGRATGVDIGAGASVPAFVNAGVINTKAGTSTTGGAANAVTVEAGGTLPSLTNSGTMNAVATGTGNYATTILDRSGTLTSITNSGTISALGGATGLSRAIDLSAGNGATTIANSGTITGDILFGSGNATLTNTAGTVTGNLMFGAGADQLIETGASTVTGTLSQSAGGTLNVALSGTSKLVTGGTVPTLANLTLGDSAVLAVNLQPAGAPTVNVTGTASFTGTSSIQLHIAQPVGSGQFVIVNANGGLTTDHGATLVDATAVPFLYALGNIAVTANQIVVTLNQKTAAQLGFSTNFAPLVDSSFVALAKGTTGYAALATLTDQASVSNAFHQIAPPTYGQATIRLAETEMGAGFGAVYDRLDAVRQSMTHPRTENIHGIWVQEISSFSQQSTNGDDPGFKNTGLGVAGGIDRIFGRNLILGFGVTNMWNSVRQSDASAGGQLSETSLMGDVYAGYTSGPFFINGVATLGSNKYDFNRILSFGGFSGTATGGWSGYQYGGELVIGARLGGDHFFVQPSNAVSVGKVHINGYTTGSGAGDFALNVQAQTFSIATDTARADFGIRWGKGDSHLELAAHVGYVAQLSRPASTLNAAFVLGGPSFTLTSNSIGAGGPMGGASFGYYGPDFSLAATASYETDSGYHNASGGITLRLNF